MPGLHSPRLLTAPHSCPLSCRNACFPEELETALAAMCRPPTLQLSALRSTANQCGTQVMQKSEILKVKAHIRTSYWLSKAIRSGCLQREYPRLTSLNADIKGQRSTAVLLSSLWPMLPAASAALSSSSALAAWVAGGSAGGVDVTSVA